MADFDISSILNSLSPQDMENIKNLASEFLGNNTPEPPKEQPQKEQPPRMPDLGSLQSLPQFCLCYRK